MADSIVIACPECKATMKVAAAAAGKKARCAKCKAVIVVKAPSAKPAAPGKAPAATPAAAGVSFEDDDGPAMYSMSAVADDDDDAEAAPPPPPPPPPPPKPAPLPKLKGAEDEDGNPYGINAPVEIARCPHCAKEMESNEAVVCLHCGYNTLTRIHTETRRVFERTFWDWCKWLGPGIACVLTIAGLVGFDLWFCFGLNEMWKGWDDAIGTSSISQGVRLWIVVMTLWVMWKALKFAVRRLILNPVPPEIERKK